ncbi:phosphopantetheine-binding protein [Nocardiopsis trehalosi]|uniref:phosphopantetheine-binding protein n=1 Tax=Nocardiopsis trehalosi TaxID=109329 RepID=UPI000833E784|nr:phosphopantetheine-binding protein [Nocardiopsis trehalosi]
MPEPATPAGPLTPERLRADVEHVLGEPAGAIADDEDLLDRGMDSIRLMSLVETWRAAGVETDFITLAEDASVAAWTRLLLDR